MDKEFYKNIFTMFTGTSAAQLIWILTIPFLTRMFSAAEFGVYQLFLSTTSIIIIFATARYETAIIVPKLKNEAIYLTFIPIILSSLYACVILFCLYFFKIEFSIFDGILLNKYVKYIPIYIVLLSVYQSFYMWYIREKRYKIISMCLILFPVCNLFFAYFLQQIFYFSNGLVISTVLSRGIECIYFTYFFIKEINFNFRFSLIRLKCVLKKYIDFPKYMILGDSIDNFAASLPAFLLNIFFGNQVTGYYSLANQCLNMPISLVSKSIGDVFKQGASKKYTENKECKDFYNANLKLLIKVSLIIGFFIFILAPVGFKIFFGPEWVQSGEYARYLILLFCGGVISSPLSNIFILARFQKLYLYIQIALLMINLTVLFIGGFYFKDIYLILFLLGLSKMIISMVIIYKGGQIANGKKI